MAAGGQVGNTRSRRMMFSKSWGDVQTRDPEAAAPRWADLLLSKCDGNTVG